MTSIDVLSLSGVAIALPVMVWTVILFATVRLRPSHLSHVCPRSKRAAASC